MDTTRTKQENFSSREYYMKKFILEKSFADIGKESEQFMKQKSYAKELEKGCTDQLDNSPVCIEPANQPYRVNDFGSQKQLMQETVLYTSQKNIIAYSYLRVWFAQKDETNNRESFNSIVNSFSSLNTWSVFVGGNKERNMIVFAVPKKDVLLAKNVLLTNYPHAEIAVLEKNPILRDTDFSFTEHYTAPPYNSVLLSPENSLSSGILQSLSNLDTDECAFFQLLIQPCRFDWGTNKYHLCHMERSGGVPQNQWRENGYGNEYSDEAKKKLHAPHNALIIRTGTKSKNDSAVLRSLNSTLLAYRWRGEVFRQIPKKQFINKLGKEKTNQMIQDNLAYRAGSILSSSELASLSPLPTKEDLTNPRFKINKASGLYIFEKETNGALVGEMHIAGKKRGCCVAEKDRMRGITIAGDTGSGKTGVEEALIRADMDRRRKSKKEHPEVKLSVVGIDYSNDLFSLILNALKIEDVEDTDIFTLSIPGYLPKWNPVALSENENIDRKADNLTYRIKNLFTESQWSPGIHELFFNASYLALADPEGTLPDIPKHLESDSDAKNKRAEILKDYVDNPQVQLYWRKTFFGMDERTKKIASRKISAFLAPKRVQQMFSIKENAFDHATITNEGRACFVSLDEGDIGLGPMVFTGGFHSQSFCDTTIARRHLYSEEELEKRPCYIHIDEFFRAPIKAFESATVSLRKHNVSLTLSYHFEEQLSKEVQMGLKNLSTHIVMKQSYTESKRAHAQFLGKIPIQDFQRLKEREGYIITPNSEIRKFRTILRKKHNNEAVIKKTHREKYTGQLHKNY